MNSMFGKRNFHVGIIYCHQRIDCVSLAKDLSGLGFSAAAYHAGLAGSIRERVQVRLVLGLCMWVGLCVCVLVCFEWV